MATYAEKETKVLNKISRTITELGETLEKMADTDSKVTHFYEQEKAIHEIRVIIRKAKKVERLVNEEIITAIDEVVYETEEELKLAQEINQEFDKLDLTLGSIGETDSKVKSYLEQQKALHEAKKILEKAKKINLL